MSHRIRQGPTSFYGSQKSIRNSHIWYISDSAPPPKSGLSSASKKFLPWIWISSEWCYLRLGSTRSRLWDKDSRANSLFGKFKNTSRREGRWNKGRKGSQWWGIIKPATTVWWPEPISLGKWYKINIRVIPPEKRGSLCVHQLSSVFAWGLRDINSLVLSACHLQTEQPL